MSCKDCDYFEKNYSDNDDEKSTTDTKEDNTTEAENTDNNDNDEEDKNFVVGALVIDFEREDSSSDAREKPSRMNDKMGKIPWYHVC